MANVFAGFSVDTNFCKVKSMENDMEESFFVEHEGWNVELSPDVARQLGLYRGQQVDRRTFDLALRLTCKHQIAICRLNISIDEFNQAEEPKSI